MQEKNLKNQEKRPNHSRNPDKKFSQKNGEKKNFRNFFNSGKKLHTNSHLKPGDSFVFEDSFRPRKSFPFLTPTQALKKFLHPVEERAKPLEKETLRVIPFGGVEQVGLNCMGF